MTIQATLDKYFTYIGGGKFITTSKNGDCYALTTRHRSRPLHRMQDNYIVEIKK